MPNQMLDDIHAHVAAGFLQAAGAVAGVAVHAEENEVEDEIYDGYFGDDPAEEPVAHIDPAEEPEAEDEVKADHLQEAFDNANVMNQNWNVVEVGGAAPAIMVGDVPQPEEMPAPAAVNAKKIAEINAIKQAAHFEANPGIPGALNVPVYKPAGGYKQQYQQQQPLYSSASTGLKGLMVFYVNTGNMPTGTALDMIDKMKVQYKAIETGLKAKNVEVMWMPRSSGKTTVKYIPID